MCTSRGAATPRPTIPRASRHSLPETERVQRAVAARRFLGASWPSREGSRMPQEGPRAASWPPARRRMPLKIDVFNHIFPKPFFERLKEVAVDKGPIKRWFNIPFLHDT